MTATIIPRQEVSDEVLNLIMTLKGHARYLIGEGHDVYDLTEAMLSIAIALAVECHGPESVSRMLGLKADQLVGLAVLAGDPTKQGSSLTWPRI